MLTFDIKAIVVSKDYHTYTDSHTKTLDSLLSKNLCLE